MLIPKDILTLIFLNNRDHYKFIMKVKHYHRGKLSQCSKVMLSIAQHCRKNPHLIL